MITGKKDQSIKLVKTPVGFLTTLDLRYAYAQSPIDGKTKNSSNSTRWGRATGIHQLQTEFYKLIAMSAYFQKAIDFILANYKIHLHS